MNVTQLCSTVVAVAAMSMAACNRPESRAEVKAEVQAVALEAGADAKVVAVKAGDKLADGWLTTKVQGQYFADKDVKARYVNVSSRDGVVTLRGRVDDENAHVQAVQIAKNTDGVTQVVDQLTVGPPPPKSTPEQMESTWVTTRIQARYFADQEISGRDIDVSTTSGVVTLSGRVDNERERQKALAIARETSGVTRVEDRLLVQPSAVATGGTAGVVSAVGSAVSGAVAVVDDARITSMVQAKYFLDDTVKGRRLDVVTKDGVVTVRGFVASEAERTQALMLARTTDGARRVEDSLTVNAALSGTEPAPPAR